MVDSVKLDPYGSSASSITSCSIQGWQESDWTHVLTTPPHSWPESATAWHRDILAPIFTRLDPFFVPWSRWDHGLTVANAEFIEMTSITTWSGTKL